MSQGSILELLEKEKKPLDANEIRKKTGIRNVGRSLATLRKYKEIKWVWKVIAINHGTGMGERSVIHYYV